VRKENGIPPSVVSLVIPAKAEYIALVRLALAGLLRPRAVGPEVIADVKLALTEACSNSIRHAYADGREGEVEIRYELADSSLAVEVSDEGGGFDPALLERLGGGDAEIHAGRERARHWCDLHLIAREIDALQQASYKLSEEMYKATAGAPAGAPAGTAAGTQGPGPGPQGSKPGDDVIDAEYKPSQ